MKALLRIADLHVHYGGIEAVKGIDLILREGRITALLGANGAGKSTTLLTISGVVKASAGSIHFDGMELRHLPPHRIVAHGIVQVPEGREILTTLTVKENLLLGAYRRHRHKADIETDLENVLRLFPRLKERLAGAAGNLSGGEQQMLAIARALMARPRLLLLDEPSMGLAPLLVQEIFRTLRQLNERGLTIFLVEQNVRQALKIADDAYILENGKTVLSGPSAEMLNNPRVVQAYLGD
jgi:branched-chain amino acid transport system ATP-binding protein